MTVKTTISNGDVGKDVRDTLNNALTNITTNATNIASKADQAATTAALAAKANATDLAAKANQSDLTALTTTVGNKANTSDVNTALAAKADQAATTTALNAKAAASDLTALTTTVGTKANQSDLTTLTTTVGTKANQSDLTALTTTVSLKALATDLVSTNTTISNLYVKQSSDFDTALNNRGIVLTQMQMKARYMLERIRRVSGIFSTIASPLTPSIAVFSGSLKAVPNTSNNSITCTVFGGPPVQNGDGSWAACPITSGYGYRQSGRGTAYATVFDGTSLQVVGREYGGSSMGHRLVVNGQYVTATDRAGAQFTGYISNGTSGTAGTLLTITAITTTPGATPLFYTGMPLGATGITASTTLGTLSSGTAGTVGAVYNVNNSQALGTSAAPVAFAHADNTYSHVYDLSSFGAAGVQKEVALYIDENYHFKGFSSAGAADKFYAMPYDRLSPISAACFADSYGDAQQDSSLFGGLRGGLQEALGFYVTPMGLGGQGFVTSSNGFASHTARIAAGDLNLGYNKDLLVICGSVNDTGQTAATLTANITTCLTTARTQNPNAIIVFVSGFRCTAKAPTAALNTAALAGFTAALGSDPWATSIDTYAADAGVGWQILTGGNANIATYQDADNTHQNTNGYRYLTKRIANALEAFLVTKAGF